MISVLPSFAFAPCIPFCVVFLKTAAMKVTPQAPDDLAMKRAVNQLMLSRQTYHVRGEEAATTTVLEQWEFQVTVLAVTPVMLMAGPASW